MSFGHRKLLSTIAPINPPPSVGDFDHAPPSDDHYNEMSTCATVTIYVLLVSYFLAIAFHFARLSYLRWVRSGRFNPPLTHRSPRGFVVQERVPEADSSSGLQQSAIDSIIGQRKYRRGETECCCCVCQFDFDEDESVRVLPSCGHVYHVPCIDPWLRFHDNCPLCRALVGGDQETEHGGALFLNVIGGDGFDRNLDSAVAIQIDEDCSGDGVVGVEVEIGEPMGRNRENLDSKLKRWSSFSNCGVAGGRSRLDRVLMKSASFD